MSIQVSFDGARMSAPWCVQGEGLLVHFESEAFAKQFARSHGWKESLRDQIAEVLVSKGCYDDPESTADKLLENFNITEKEVS